MGVKSLCRHQLTFSAFRELRRCCLQQWDLAIRLWRATYSLGSSLVIWGFPRNPSGQKFNVTQSRDWKLHLVTRGDQLGLCLPSLFSDFCPVISVRLPSHVCTFWEASVLVGLYTPLKWPLILDISPHSPSPSHPHFSLLFQGPPPIHGYLFYFPFLKRYFCSQALTP